MLWHRFVMKKFQALAQLMEKVLGVNFELFFCYTYIIHVQCIWQRVTFVILITCLCMSDGKLKN